MVEYHVGCGVFGIYAGTLMKDKQMWRNKSDVTKEALGAVASYLISNEEEFVFIWKGDNKKYVLRVVELSEGVNEHNHDQGKDL